MIVSTWPRAAVQPSRSRTPQDKTPWCCSSSAVLTFSPVFSSSLPLLVEDGVSSPSRDTRTKSSLLRVDTESEDTLIFPTEPLSSMAAAVKLSHAAHEWKTGGGGGARGGGSGGRWWAKSPGKGKRNKERKEAKTVMTCDDDSWNKETKHILRASLTLQGLMLLILLHSLALPYIMSFYETYCLHYCQDPPTIIYILKKLQFTKFRQIQSVYF